MTLSKEQLNMIGIAGRISSTLSILGSFIIIGAFCFSRYFRSPIHRIIFFNSFYNLIDSAGTMISVAGPAAGDTSSLCQFQGFTLQMFPLADVLWTFAMSFDTYLVVFHHFDAHSLQKLELKYVAVISALTGIPAVVFLFIRTPDKGPIYGGETIWCSISPHWMLIRLILYYMPVWYVHLTSALVSRFLTFTQSRRIVIAVVMIIYGLIGIEIFRLRDEFKLTEDDHIALASASTSRLIDHTDSSVTTIVESNINNKPALISESQITSQLSMERIPTPRQSPRHFRTANLDPPTQRRISFKQYILMPTLFFLALLTTWVTPTINRVSLFIHPDHQSYSLLLAYHLYYNGYERLEETGDGKKTC
ncbi:uncharacterized protein N7482_005633 [Penicillium canariense]|uniref:G-protein coupled receptors family 2 profile 2 domain-containing protein n=1 Tax=Penicillium canariense TaxID=189055 RepID=A0A9W9I6Y4_9EURO|nr:uncharacterized protein N7482_005633 [Penicillium canariense]KAJ5166852.1 hypothetical protein N7482_005633 [Penicillium canariense]